jgi:hypothetical protein
VQLDQGLGQGSNMQSGDHARKLQDLNFSRENMHMLSFLMWEELQASMRERWTYLRPMSISTLLLMVIRI